MTVSQQHPNLSAAACIALWHGAATCGSGCAIREGEGLGTGFRGKVGGGEAMLADEGSCGHHLLELVDVAALLLDLLGEGRHVHSAVSRQTVSLKQIPPSPWVCPGYPTPMTPHLVSHSTYHTHPTTHTASLSKLAVGDPPSSAQEPCPRRGWEVGVGGAAGGTHDLAQRVYTGWSLANSCSPASNS